MPELPEVEITRQGIMPYLQDHVIKQVIIRQARLRWPIPQQLVERLPGMVVHAVCRRGKYLVLHFSTGQLLIHLGMSGSLRIVDLETPAQKHDHFDLVFEHHCLRFRDPRRFGSILWHQGPTNTHPLLQHLGPEPLSSDFDGAHLHRCAKHRKIAIKPFIMDAKVVVGVGNIYANEALFASGIHPARRCNRIAMSRYANLAHHIKRILTFAIEQGGTTLQDFRDANGNPGYFARALNVYDRAGMPCPRCGRAIRRILLAQRASFYCPNCQR